jgi:hypothetical protein
MLYLGKKLSCDFWFVIFNMPIFCDVTLSTARTNFIRSGWKHPPLLLRPYQERLETSTAAAKALAGVVGNFHRSS